MALDATVGGPSAQTYASLDELKAIMEAIYTDDVVEAFFDQEEPQQEIQVEVGALMLNMLPYRGSKSCREQRLAFPRFRTVDIVSQLYVEPDRYLTYQEVLDNEAYPPTIPQEAKYAQAVIVWQTIYNGIMQMEPNSFAEMDLKRFTLGGQLEIEFNTGTAGKAIFSKARNSVMDIANAYLFDWIATVVGGVV